MRVAAIYDIHGNLPALEAVLRQIRTAGVSRLVVGGDVVPGPMPRQTLRCLLDSGVTTYFLRGNGERAVLARRKGQETDKLPQPAREAIRWVAEQLTPEDEQVLASWPETLTLPVDGLGEVLFCHATPRNDSEIFTRLTAEERLLPVFAGVRADVVVCGHTHMQFERMVGALRVVNAGSVGMPFGSAGAYWALLGSEIELRRTDYHLAQAASQVKATGYPGAEKFAARNVLAPPSEVEMLAIFERAELRS